MAAIASPADRLTPGDERGVQFCPGKQIGEDEVEVPVEAELNVRRFGAWQGVPAFTQFEVFEAVRVRPR